MAPSLTPPVTPSSFPRSPTGTPSGSHRKHMSLGRRAEQQRPPVIFRVLSTLLPIIAALLLVTTVYLFHLHHAHHSLEDGEYGLDFGWHYAPGGGVANHSSSHHSSPGGSALRHKMDLAHFLLKKYNDARAEDGRKEAMENGGWRGGSEANFIKLVEKISHKDGGGKKDDGDDGAEAASQHTAGGDDGDDEEEEEELDGNEMALKASNNNHVGKDTIIRKKGDPSVHKMSWQQLQRNLIDKDLLPHPIPSSHAAGASRACPPTSLAPAIEGASRGTITCPSSDASNPTDPRVERVLSSMLAFWNEPRGVRDRDAGTPKSQMGREFVPPPLDAKEHRRRYLTFEPDTGGWNNLRMSVENILTLAAVSGRTLVLPPTQVIYLLDAKKGDKKKGRNYDDFFNLTENAELMRRVPIISSEEFLKREGGVDGLVPLDGYNATYREHLLSVSKNCEERKKSDIYCEDLYDHFLAHGQLSPVSAEYPNENCFLFDADVFNHGEEYKYKLDPKIKERVSKFCQKRSPIFYNRTMHEAPLWHFETMDFRYRLLVHSYAFIFFTDPRVGNYYKRFVRDFLRYHDDVFCAAGKIVLALQYEDYLLQNPVLSSNDDGKKSLQSPKPSFDLDSELMGGYSSLHIRRGDLQFKEVKFDSLTWYQNTKEIWKPNEVLYIATDERNQTFFDDFRNQHSGPLRFFDDYRQLAGLDDLDPTLYGMIDTVVASRGTVFAGTWFSTFSGYIIRLRGYYGVSKYYSYYSWLDRKYFMHHWTEVGGGSWYAREYPVAWTSIDGENFVDSDNEADRDDNDAGDDNQPGKLFSREDMDVMKAKAMVVNANSVHKRGVIGGGEDISLAGLRDDEHLGRGIAGRPMNSTPALIGAKRGHIKRCDVNVDTLAYWNEPQGARDSTFVTPFGDNQQGSKPKYLVFTADKGGFNNVRMSFEIIFIIAAALDRILVLPPEQPMYLLRNDGAKKHRGLDEFFDMDGDDYKKRVKYITMEKFIQTEGHPGGQFPVPADKMDDILRASKVCAPGRLVGEGFAPCDIIHEYLVEYAHTPNITAAHHQCLVFDKGMYIHGIPDDINAAQKFCNEEGSDMKERKMVFVTKSMQRPSLLYVQGGKPPTRMLAHFYGYLHFTDSAVGNYYKRYVRDLLHVRHEIFCAAGKIVKALQDAAKKEGFSIDSEGGGGYSSLHVRRGDFQYKKMRIPAETWYENTENVWLKNEILYIATDESDKEGFFEPFRRAGHNLYFLNDFREQAGLDTIDPNWMGMIDVIVASRGRAFAGTFRSTFSGYINRLRGYYGMSMKNSWFGQYKERRMMHEWRNVNLDTYAREWPDAWMGIDADVPPAEDVF
eukprot:CAMPEP_0181129138 /NCGR_PEP_ID=MMETSP1071-20121207/29161_1 /TAXON_ID=35127 /ORGANISM="Thalassiosira sp., Strain NH16" /LENGTH=1337 /DNA_ID=CAMNT_0023215103 /DNA_START=9 /DNA_END=4023 /DNA_ORIENTATION=-